MPMQTVEGPSGIVTLTYNSTDNTRQYQQFANSINQLFDTNNTVPGGVGSYTGTGGTISVTNNLAYVDPGTFVLAPNTSGLVIEGNTANTVIGGGNPALTIMSGTGGTTLYSPSGNTTIVAGGGGNMIDFQSGLSNVAWLNSG